LLPTELNLLRWKLNQKAKREPKFRFCALYDRIYRSDVLETAWKLVDKYGKAAGVDGVTREKLEAIPGGVEGFLQEIHSAVKQRDLRSNDRVMVGLQKAYKTRTRLAPFLPSGVK
jgi:RNA-directed DNA polymerase